MNDDDKPWSPYDGMDPAVVAELRAKPVEPPPYHPIPNTPWPPSEGWILAWWDDEHGHWVGGMARTDKNDAVELMNRLTARGELVWRLVKEVRTYTTEEA